MDWFVVNIDLFGGLSFDGLRVLSRATGHLLWIREKTVEQPAAHRPGKHETFGGQPLHQLYNITC